MTHSLSLYPFPGYGLSYDLLVQFCTLFAKTHSQHSRLLGPTCIIRGDELSEEEIRAGENPSGEPTNHSS